MVRDSIVGPDPVEGRTGASGSIAGPREGPSPVYERGRRPLVRVGVRQRTAGAATGRRPDLGGGRRSARETKPTRTARGVNLGSRSFLELLGRSHKDTCLGDFPRSRLADGWYSDPGSGRSVRVPVPGSCGVSGLGNPGWGRGTSERAGPHPGLVASGAWSRSHRRRRLCQRGLESGRDGFLVVEEIG